MLLLTLAGFLLLAGLILVASLAWAFLLTGLVTGFAYSTRVAHMQLCGGIGKVTAIVPMRNEANNVDDCLTLLLSDPAIEEIVVVDDHSNDGTQDAVRRFFHNKKVKLLSAPEIQNGWSGKSNACYAGALASDSSWLLFIDADTFVSSEIVSRSVDLAETKKLDAVTCFGGLRCQEVWDKIAVPFYFALLNSFIKFGGYKKGKGSYFIGSFILIKRSEYFRIGGHASVAHELVEDKALSEIALKFGLRFEMVYAPKLLSTEWAPGFKNGTEALSREMLPIMVRNPRSSLGFSIALTFLFVLPLVSLFVSLQDFLNEFIFLGFLALILELAISIYARRIMQLRKRDYTFSILFILPEIIFLFVLWASVFKMYTTPRISWCGRSYDLD